MVQHMLSRLSILSLSTKFALQHLVFLLILASCSACAFPKKSLTQINIQGQIITPQGTPLSGERVEVSLPSGYGLNDIDKDYVKEDQAVTPREIGIIQTDALGSFSYTFKPVPYATAYWILPPVGSVPGTPPEPYFYVRLLSDPSVVYAVLVKEDEVIYSAYDNRQAPGQNALMRPPVQMKGSLIADERKDISVWIADIKLRRWPDTRAQPNPKTILP